MKTLEELELDYKNHAEMLHRVVRGEYKERAEEILESFKKASDAYYMAKYGRIKWKRN